MGINWCVRMEFKLISPTIQACPLAYIHIQAHMRTHKIVRIYVDTNRFANDNECLLREMNCCCRQTDGQTDRDIYFYACMQTTQRMNEWTRFTWQNSRLHWIYWHSFRMVCTLMYNGWIAVIVFYSLATIFFGRLLRMMLNQRCSSSIVCRAYVFVALFLW